MIKIGDKKQKMLVCYYRASIECLFIVYVLASYNLLATSGIWLRWLSGKPSFSKKQADLFFPPDFADDFPVSMQV